MARKCPKIKKVSGNFEKGSTFDIATNLTEFRETPKGKSTEGKISSKIVFESLIIRASQ